MKKILTLSIAACILLTVSAQKRHTISGTVTDENGETLIGVNIFNSVKDLGAVTNAYGFYSLTLPEGPHEIVYSYIGFNLLKQEVILDKNLKLNVRLMPETKRIDEVVVYARRPDQNITDMKMGTVQLQPATIKRIPVLLGETDLIKSIQLLPGVQSSVEGSSGFYVRGGNADQNLVLLDEAVVYNPSHFFGFFSTFNSDAVKNVELFKGGIPAEYGGRLSSVLDVRLKDGNMERLKGEGGIGLMSNRLTLDGPLIKDKVSAMLSARVMTTGLYLAFANDTLASQSRVYFYDLNAKVNWVVSDRDRIFLSGYFGRDVNRFGKLFMIDYGNATGTLRWNHVFNSKWFSNLTLIYSNFNYELGSPTGTSAFKWISGLTDIGVKYDYTYYMNPRNTIRFGIQSIHHTFHPGRAEGIGESIINNLKFPDAYSLENGLFVSNDQNVTDRLGLSYGLRFSHFSNIGKATLYTYGRDYKVSDTLYYGHNEIFNTFYGWEPRLSARYTLTHSSSLKAGYNRMYQYLHLASNSTATFPLDLWFMSNPNVRPQYADQVALGYFRNFSRNAIETSVEVYYKKMYDIIDYKDHAFLVPNPRLEGELRRGNADAYGVELMVRKQSGKLNGWVSYTLSRALRHVPEVNDGLIYPAPYDKPHNISVVANYDLNRRFNFSANWVYSSAIPVTVPDGGFYYGNIWIPHYSRRNAVRIPGTAYHRLDLSANINFWWRGLESTLNISVYNAYNRHNAFALSFRDRSLRGTRGLAEDPEIQGRGVDVIKLYLFPIIPAITYNFKF